MQVNFGQIFTRRWARNGRREERRENTEGRREKSEGTAVRFERGFRLSPGGSSSRMFIWLNDFWHWDFPEKSHRSEKAELEHQFPFTALPTRPLRSKLLRYWAATLLVPHPVFRNQDHSTGL